MYKEGNKDVKHLMVQLFPELKESEDERIRKELIKETKCCEVRLFETVTNDEFIDWLEKQYEHSKFRDSIKVGDKVTRNQDGVLVNLSQLKRVAKPAVKQGKQKPTDKVEQKFIKVKYADTSTDAFIEKALAYLHNKFYFNNVFYGIVSTDFNAMEEMYEDFRKYMEGE